MIYLLFHHPRKKILLAWGQIKVTTIAKACAGFISGLVFALAASSCCSSQGLMESRVLPEAQSTQW